MFGFLDHSLKSRRMQAEPRRNQAYLYYVGQVITKVHPEGLFKASLSPFCYWMSRTLNTKSFSVVLPLNEEQSLLGNPKQSFILLSSFNGFRRAWRTPMDGEACKLWAFVQVKLGAVVLFKDSRGCIHTR